MHPHYLQHESDSSIHPTADVGKRVKHGVRSSQHCPLSLLQPPEVHNERKQLLPIASQLMQRNLDTRSYFAAKNLDSQQERFIRRFQKQDYVIRVRIFE